MSKGKRDRKAQKFSKKQLEDLDSFGAGIFKDIMGNILPIKGFYELNIFEAAEGWKVIMFRERTDLIIPEPESDEPNPDGT